MHNVLTVLFQNCFIIVKVCIYVIYITSVYPFEFYNIVIQQDLEGDNNDATYDNKIST